MKINPNLLYESGSNANGNYIKYEDGTMICYGNKTGNINFSSSWGAGLYNTDNISFSNFAQPFKSVPVVLVNLNSNQNGYLYGLLSSGNDGRPTTTNPGSYTLFRPNNANNVPYSISYVAIGKWK